MNDHRFIKLKLQYKYLPSDILKPLHIYDSKFHVYIKYGSNV